MAASAFDLEAIRNSRLTDVGENSDLASLKSAGFRALPSSPTANGWTADAIKKHGYMPPEMLFKWLKQSNDASAEAFEQINAIIVSTSSTQFRVGSRVVGVVTFDDDE